MEALISFIIICQAFGAIVGAVSAVWGEIAYVRAIRDGKIDHAERLHLQALAHGLRWGMTLLLLSSFGLVVVAYLEHATVQPATTTAYWIFVALALLVIFISWALSRRRVSFAIGSAIAFTGWWFLAYLMLGLFPALSFGSAVAFFVVATGAFYLFLSYARLLAHKK